LLAPAIRPPIDVNGKVKTSFFQRVAMQKRCLESVVRHESPVDCGITSTAPKCSFSMRENDRGTESAFQTGYTHRPARALFRDLYHPGGKQARILAHFLVPSESCKSPPNQFVYSFPDVSEPTKVESASKIVNVPCHDQFSRVPSRNGKEIRRSS
jgi:hypothetical protein